MVTMSAIWDRTAEVLRGRGSMLAGIAGLLILLPAAVQDAVVAWGGAAPGAAALVGLLALAVGVLSIWGNLALVAAASDPAVDRAEAVAIGGRRLLPAFGLSLLIGLAAILVVAPAFAMLGVGAMDLASVSRGVPRLAAAPSPGLVLGAGLYLILASVVVTWVAIRLSLFLPVIVNERLGLRSLRRSFELTRGLAWRILGVALLFGILLLVALSAAQLVGALATRLIVGADGVAAARFVGAVAGAAVTAGGTVVSATFTAQLYRVVSGREAAQAFA